MEFSKATIEEQQKLIEEISNIKISKDKQLAFEEAKKCLEVTEENKGGIVFSWLEQKMLKFKQYLLNKIIIDTNLPIYFEETINEQQINYSLETLNSIDSACSKIKEEWIKKNMNIFLNAILNEKNSKRYKEGEAKFLEFYNRIYENYLITAFIDNFNPMIYNILNIKINDSNTRFLSFAFIRRMTDCIYSKEISGLSINLYFNKKLSEVFSNSKRLIRNLFAYEFIKSLELFQINNIPSGEFIKENNIIEYNYDDIDIIIRFKPKEKGINSGFILNIIKIEQSNKSEIVLNSFYVKKYYGSSKSGSKNFEKEDSGSFFTLSPLTFKTSFSSYEKTNKPKKRKFDLKEPFLYTLLNLLNYVPEVKFFINPYTLDGFYIITKNISDQKNSFLSLSAISMKNVKDNHNFMNESINQADFISRIFRLRDLHNENFGFIVENSQQIFKSLAIIDFIQPIFMETYQISNEKLIKDFLNCSYSEQRNEGIRILTLDNCDLDEKEIYIKTVFLKVEEKTRIVNGFNSLQQFNKRIESAKIKQINFSEIKEKIFKEEEPDDDLDDKFRNILNVSLENIKNLMLKKRGIENNSEEIMLRDPKLNQPRTNAELIGFNLGKKKGDFDLLEGRLDYLDDAFEDLDNYCQSIMHNYKILKKFINDSYNK